MEWLGRLWNKTVELFYTKKDNIIEDEIFYVGIVNKGAEIIIESFGDYFRCYNLCYSEEEKEKFNTVFEGIISNEDNYKAQFQHFPVPLSSLVLLIYFFEINFYYFLSKINKYEINIELNK